MKMKAEIEIPENASWQTIEDAKLSAVWRTVITKDDRMRNTNLSDKCGSCVNFDPRPDLFSTSYGFCMKRRKGYKSRTCKKCKLYERKKDDD